MKLFVLKVISLLVCIAGLLALAVACDCSYIQGKLGVACPVTVGVAGCACCGKAVGGGVGGLMFLLGLYGFLPKLCGCKKRTIVSTGEFVDNVIDLDAAEKTMTGILSKLPEVKKIKVAVSPDRERRKAMIQANVLLKTQPGVSAKRVYALLNRYVKETAVTTLGLNIALPIQLNVEGIEVDAKAAGKALNAQFASLSDEELLEPVRMESVEGKGDAPCCCPAPPAQAWEPAVGEEAISFEPASEQKKDEPTF
jgi:hypothetical protein